MTKLSLRFADAALNLVGTPFRLYGRSRQFGLDCIGVALACCKAVGLPIPTLPQYRLRNTDIGNLSDFAGQAGFAPAQDSIKIGDLLFVDTGPAQLHLLIAVHDGKFVHADAGLRRVAKTPCIARWPIIEQFRLFEKA